MTNPETLAHQAAELRQQAEASDQAHTAASPNRTFYTGCAV